jgi:hypothetical protein
MIEGDVITKQERIDVCSTQADLFSEQEHFDAPAIVAKKAALMERYEKLKVCFARSLNVNKTIDKCVKL